MFDNTKKIDELISLYTLENELFDFYVEGITDKLILDNYNNYKKKNLKIIEIDTIDFSDYNFDDLDFTSNKDKLIALSRILISHQTKSNVKCLIDNDFDGILSPIETNLNLIRTDYCCIESYFLCRKIIQKFIDFGIRNFPHDTDLIINEIGNVLRYLFIIRLVKVKFNLNVTLLKIENNIIIDKQSGKINFSIDNYLTKFIQANNLNDKKSEILKFVQETKINLNSDFKNTMNGHDFIHILFLYINKIKPSTGFKHDTFEKAFLLSLQPNHFDDFDLFKLIAS